MKEPEFLKQAEANPSSRGRTAARAGTRKKAAPSQAKGKIELDSNHLLAAESNPPGVLSVQFELFDPLANQVCVAGSFNGWQPATQPLTKDPDGKWRATLCLPPGRHEYRFVVDRVWKEDPMAEQAVDNPFGGRNSVVVVINRDASATP